MILIKLAPCLKNITHNSQRKPLWNIPVFGECKEANLGPWQWWCCYIKIISIYPNKLEILLAWIWGTVQGIKAHLGRYRRITSPARVSTSCWLAKRTEVVTHPLLHDLLCVSILGASHPFYLFCSLPWIQRHGLHNRLGKTYLLFCWGQVHKFISLVQFSAQLV